MGASPEVAREALRREKIFSETSPRETEPHHPYQDPKREITKGDVCPSCGAKWKSISSGTDATYRCENGHVWTTTSMALMALRSKTPKRTGLENALKDEASADIMYENLAREATEAGHPEEASKLRGIASDERRHRGILEDMIRRLGR